MNAIARTYDRKAWRQHVPFGSERYYIKPGDLIDTPHGTAVVASLEIDAPHDPNNPYPLPCWPWTDKGYIGVHVEDCETDGRSRYVRGVDLFRPHTDAPPRIEAASAKDLRRDPRFWLRQEPAIVRRVAALEGRSA